MSKDLNNEALSEENWRDTMFPPRLWAVNGYVIFMAGPAVIKWGVFTATLAIVGIAAFWVFQMKGYEPIEALKAVRSYLVGDHRPSVPLNRRRYWR